jgi:hypothetical protein
MPATSTIAALTLVLAANLTDAAVFPTDDANGNTRKATIAQMRTQLNTGAQIFTSTISVAGISTLAAVTATSLVVGATSATNPNFWLGFAQIVGTTNAAVSVLKTTGPAQQWDMDVPGDGTWRLTDATAGLDAITVTKATGAITLKAVTAALGLTVSAGGITVSAGNTLLQTLELNSAATASGGNVRLGGSTQSTIGANGAASALTANPLGYIIGYIGATKIVLPYYNG